MLKFQEQPSVYTPKGLEKTRRKTTVELEQGARKELNSVEVLDSEILHKKCLQSTLGSFERCCCGDPVI